MSEADSKEPGAARRALFQDVPFILDSLWSRAEFKANRIGVVRFEEKEGVERGLAVRSPWLSGVFVLYILVCAFSVFGPTLDAMCSVDSTDFALNSRRMIMGVLALAAAWLFLKTLNAATFHLARKALVLTAAQPQAAPASAPRTRVRQVFGSIIDNTIWNTVRMFGKFPDLGWPDRRALSFGFVTLFIGAFILVTPILAGIRALWIVEVDPQSCVQVDHENLVRAQLIAFVTLLAGGGVLWRWPGKKNAFHLFLATFALLGIVIGVLWWKFSPPELSEAAGGFYPHVYVILIGALLAMALIARIYAWWMFRRFSTTSEAMLRGGIDTQDMLNVERDPPDVSGLRLWSALVNGVESHLLHFLLMPAFVAFMAPTSWLYWVTLVFAGVSLVLIVYGSLSSRWEQMLIFVGRWFLVGTPLIVSLLVIIIAGLRLAGVQYVATVIDATPVGVMFIIVAMLYVAVWFFEYWINRWLGEEMLSILGTREDARKGYVKCNVATDPAAFKSWAKLDLRYITLHGTGRLCAQGWYARGKPLPGDEREGQAFSTYSFAEFFTALGAKLEGGEPVAHEIRRRIGLYFNVINLALIMTMALLIAWHLNWSRPLVVTPMVDVKPPESQAHASQVQMAAPLSEAAPEAVPRVNDALAERLRAQSAAGRPSIVVAASGGGTRAAVYSAVALEGVGKIGHAKDIVLLSGVSGGGVSAAVFASRFDELSQTTPGGAENDPWVDYVNAVGQPFIQDVLEGIGELRIMGPTSLGALLQESLQRRVFDPKLDATIAQDFSNPAVPPLILNSAISGHPYDDSELLVGRVAAPREGARCAQKSRPFANLSGGRLIFTNLQNTSGFPHPMDGVPDMWLPYRIINFGNVKLSTASALTANFPPVFSNARVRIEPTAEQAAQGGCPLNYFVTDGGATENLGLVSALYALIGTLDELEPGSLRQDIHVLALEASAIDYDYSDDRGLGAATGGSKERINAGLTQTLLVRLKDLTHKHGIGLQVHYLPLPMAFRSRGGIGTHWMFAPTVTVANPHLPDKPDNSILPWANPRGQQELSKQQVILTMRALFDPEDPICVRSDRINADPANPANAKLLEAGWNTGVQRVARWICGHDDEGRPDAPKPDYQVDEWKKTIDALAGAVAPH